MGTRHAEEISPLDKESLPLKVIVECEECDGLGFVSAYDVIDDVWTETEDGAFYALSNYEVTDIAGFHAFLNGEPTILCLFCDGAGVCDENQPF